MPSIAVVMAHHSDFSGVYFTIQSIRQHQPNVVSEWIVVDQSSDSRPDIHEALIGLAGNVKNMRVIPLPEPRGTSPARDKAIIASHCDIVICLDCHVLLKPQAIPLVIDYFRQPARQRDLVQGPMLNDGLLTACTHWTPIWGANHLFGVWATAWSGGDRPLAAFKGANGCARFIWVTGDRHIQPVDPQEDTVLWEQHENFLISHGFRPWWKGQDPTRTIEIPGQGLGCFAVWRENWPGFEPHSVGFGAEEMYLHEKIRRLGGRTVCLRGMQWIHRFFKGTEAAPPPTRIEIIRNYVRFHRHLNLPLRELHEQFVNVWIDQSTWDGVIAEPYPPVPHAV